MKLEHEIKQKTFRNQRQRLLINILFTGGWLNAVQGKMLKPHGISLPQFNLLRILRGQHPSPATINLIRERMLDKMSNASRLVERLRTRDLVERAVNPNDRRACDVIITEKGLALLKELDCLERQWSDMVSHLDENEISLMNNLLDKIRDADLSHV